jgi:hypothetical protein
MATKLILFILLFARAEDANLLWQYMTEEERAIYPDYPSFEEFFESSKTYLEIRGYPSESLFVVGKGFGNYHIGTWSEMDLCGDTLYISINGQDCIKKFDLSLNFKEYFGNRFTLYYIWSVAANDRYIAFSKAGPLSLGSSGIGVIVNRSNPASYRENFVIDTGKIARLDMDSSRIYATINYIYNDQYGHLVIYRDSVWDSLYAIPGSFNSIKVDKDTLFLTDTFRLYRYAIFGDIDSVRKVDSLVFTPSQEIRLQDVATSDQWIYLAAFKNQYHPDDPDTGAYHFDSLYLYVIDRSTFTPKDTFYMGIAFHNPFYFSLCLENYGDTLFVLLNRDWDTKNRVLERYFYDGVNLTPVDSMYTTIEENRWWPSGLFQIDGNWVGTNLYDLMRLTFRRPDGGLLKVLEIPWYTYTVLPDTGGLLYVATGLNYIEDHSVNGVYLIDTTGTVLDSFVVNDYVAFRIALYGDTIVAMMDTFAWRRATLYLLDRATLDPIFVQVLPRGTVGGFYLSSNGLLFVPYNSGDYSAIKVYNLSGENLADICTDYTSTRYMTVTVDEDLYPWRVYVGSVNVTPPVYIFNFEPVTFQWERVDSFGQYKSVHSYWSWDPDLDDDYMENPDYGFVWNLSRSGHKIFLSDIFNTRVVVYLTPIYLGSDEPTATAFPNEPKLVRVPNSDFLHLVYQSQGNIYYHFSHKGGIDWSPPFVIEDAHSPALFSLDSSSVDLVYIKNGRIEFKHFNPDYTTGEPKILSIPEGNPSTPIILRKRYGDEGLLHLIYVGYEGETPVLAHSVFLTTGTDGDTLNPIEHHLIDYLSGVDTYPSIGEDPVMGHLHVVYKKNSDIYYSSYNGLSWSTPVNISNSSTPSSQPVLNIFGNKIQVLWTETQIYRSPDLERQVIWGGKTIVKTEKMLEDTWPAINTVISSYGAEAIYPLIAGEDIFFWSQRSVSPPSSWDIYIKVDSNSPANFSNTPDANSLYIQACTKLVPQGVYLYSVWTEGSSLPYKLLTTSQLLTSKPPPYYDVMVGHVRPSLFTEKRDGTIEGWKGGVDFSKDRLVYRFPSLDPKMYYELSIKFYQEGGVDWSNSIEIDGVELERAEYQPGEEKEVRITIPRSLYSDSTITVTIERLKGQGVAVSDIKLYQFESGRADGSNSKASITPKEGNLSLMLSSTLVRERAYLTYAIPSNGKVEISVYNVSGRKVTTLVDKELKKGRYQLVWDGLDRRGLPLPSGVYFVVMNFQGAHLTKKLVLFR